MDGFVEESDRRTPGQDRIMTNRMVTIVAGHGEGVVMADTVNLGSGGMFLATEEPFAVGDRFICRIDLGSPYKPVLSGAEVRWINDEAERRGVGVRFLDIAEAAESLSGELPTKGPETVRVRLPSVGPALDAEVVERDGKSIVVELELPFLEPGSQVEVGPNVAARTATVRSASWVGEKPPPMRIKLDLDVEPASVEVAAGQVVADRNRKKLRPEKKGFWQLPARIHRLRKGTASEDDAEETRADEAAPGESKGKKPKSKAEPEKAAAEEVTAEARSDKVTSEKFKANAKPQKVATKTIEATEEPDEAKVDLEKARAEPREAEVETEEAEAAPEEAEAAPEEAEAETEEDEAAPEEAEAKPAKPKEKKAQPVKAKEEAARGKEKKAAATEDGEAEADDSEEDFDPSAFNPWRGQLERILGAAVMARLVAAWGFAREWLGDRINGPKLRAAAEWCKDRLFEAGRWTADKLGPAASQSWKAIRRIPTLRRSRKQTRGEPSSVVRHLTDRARRVAARRGRTAALIAFLSLGVGGLAAAGYGWSQSNTAEDERETIQQEAERSSWTSGHWEEPEPVEPSTSS